MVLFVGYLAVLATSHQQTLGRARYFFLNVAATAAGYSSKCSSPRKRGKVSPLVAAINQPRANVSSPLLSRRLRVLAVEIKPFSARAGAHLLTSDVMTAVVTPLPVVPRFYAVRLGARPRLVVIDWSGRWHYDVPRLSVGGTKVDEQKNTKLHGWHFKSFQTSTQTTSIPGHF